MTEIDGCKIIGRASDYSGLVSALRERSAELGVTRENLDALSGVQSGYSAKLLSAVPMKSLGRVSLGPILQSLGCAILLIEDQDALRRVQHRFGAPERKPKRSGATHDVVKFAVSRLECSAARVARPVPNDSHPSNAAKRRGGRPRRGGASKRNAVRVRWDRHRAKVEAKA
jgi:hypothetical protein